MRGIDRGWHKEVAFQLEAAKRRVCECALLAALPYHRPGTGLGRQPRRAAERFIEELRLKRLEALKAAA